MNKLYDRDPNEDVYDSRQFDFGTWEDGRDAINAGFPSPPPPGQVSPPRVTSAADEIGNVNDASMEEAEDKIVQPINTMDQLDSPPIVGHTHSSPSLSGDEDNVVTGNYLPPFLFANYMTAESEAREAAVAEYAAALSPTPPSRGRQGIVDEMREEDREAEWREDYGDNGSATKSATPGEFPNFHIAGSSEQDIQQAAVVQQWSAIEEVQKAAQNTKGPFGDEGSCSMETGDSDESSDDSSDDDSSVESHPSKPNTFDAVLAPGPAPRVEENKLTTQAENVLQGTDASGVPTSRQAPITSSRPATLTQSQDQNQPVTSTKTQDTNIVGSDNGGKGKKSLSSNSLPKNENEDSDDERQPRKKKPKLSRSFGNDDNEQEYRLPGDSSSDAMDLDDPSPGVVAKFSSPVPRIKPFKGESSLENEAVRKPRNPMGKGELKSLKDNNGAKRVSTSPRRTRSRGVAKRTSERIARRTSK